ncbi:hypothetical protein DPMN_035797 [Dreissena polymorpha]|uniref:Uncharacterized protein n=1 Tax=Dreissena polymorpha TaxID=45954 RepID=A0A9D4RLC6_DREPO|nr:hypothetical protein DPMN_035797 [Dreissena polymorpha]
MIGQKLHVFQLTGTIFKLNSHIKETNVLTKFHENWAKNVTSKKNAPPTGGHVFSPISTIFELVQDINKTNPNKENCPPPGSHVIQLTGTIFELNSHIKTTNVLTNFHEKMKTAPPTGGHVLQRTRTIFDLNSNIKETNVLTKFHENWAKNVTSRVEKCPAHWRPYINKTNVLTNFHDDWAKIVTYRVFTRKTAPPTGSHVFQRTGTTFELNQHINKTDILTKLHEDWACNVTSTFLPGTTQFRTRQRFHGTKLLTKFHEDRTRNVASRVFTSQMWMTDGQTTDKDRSQKLT